MERSLRGLLIIHLMGSKTTLSKGIKYKTLYLLQELGLHPLKTELWGSLGKAIETKIKDMKKDFFKIYVVVVPLCEGEWTHRRRLLFLVCLSYSSGRTSLVVALRYLGMRIFRTSLLWRVDFSMWGFLIKNNKEFDRLEERSVWFIMSWFETDGLVSWLENLR